jgi:hypothetical protein
MDNRFFNGFIDELLKLGQGIKGALPPPPGKALMPKQSTMVKTPLETPPKGPEVGKFK